MSNGVVDHMIHFVEEKEKEQQSNQLLTGAQMKSDIVKSILDELDREVSNADSEH